MTPTEDTGGWSRSELYVKEELRRLSTQQEKIFDSLDRIGKDVVSMKTELRVRGGMFGAAGGVIAAGFIKIVELFGTR